MKVISNTGIHGKHSITDLDYVKLKNLLNSLIVS